MLVWRRGSAPSKPSAARPHHVHFSDSQMSIAENIAQVRKRIAAAASRAHRSSDEITLMGVSKTFPAERIREAYAAGLRVFGENRVQEFAGKADALRDLRDVEWHLIGHLQTNKAAKAAELFDAVDSVDSVRMAEKLNALAESAGKIIIRPDRDQCRWRAGKKRSRTRLRRTGADSARRAAMGKSENSRPDDRPALHRRSGGLATLFSSTPSDSRQHRRAQAAANRHRSSFHGHVARFRSSD